MSIRILLVDDHAIVREGIRAILKDAPEMQVTGESCNGRQAIILANKLCPDVVVMDVAMPDLNGVEATRQLLAQDPKVRIIAFSAYNDRQFVEAMLEAGAVGYVIKDSDSEELLQAIREATSTHKYLSPKILQTMTADMTGTGTPTSHLAFKILSRREREVLQLLSEGKTSKLIGAELEISTKTVDIHRWNIMKKLKLRSVAELTKYAVREGMTSL